MDLRKLKTLIDLVSESNISELEITEADGKVRIVKADPVAPAQAAAPAAMMVAAPAAAPLAMLRGAVPTTISANLPWVAASNTLTLSLSWLTTQTRLLLPLRVS